MLTEEDLYSEQIKDERMTALAFAEKVIDFISIAKPHFCYDRAISIDELDHLEYNWTIEQQKDDSQRLRLLQIDVLCKVFFQDMTIKGKDKGLACYKPDNYEYNIKFLLSGLFVLGRKKVDYADVMKKLEQNIARSTHRSEERMNGIRPWLPNYFNLPGKFAQFIRFKVKMDEILHMKAMFEHEFLDFGTPEICDVISAVDMQTINELISAIIDPSGRTFSKQELRQAYNYPIS
jgi:hypothetical protein